MQLTTFTDYSLRVLMFTHAAGGRLVTVEEIANTYGISRAHLMKVVNALTRAGFLTAVRGRFGGLRLARGAEDISLGDVVRSMEPGFDIVECFSTGDCAIANCCKLQGVLRDAVCAFLDILDHKTLADIALRPKDFLEVCELSR
jgi:Rrf2 family nitric oxide-sensitive transcriptional repressor